MHIFRPVGMTKTRAKLKKKINMKLYEELRTQGTVEKWLFQTHKKL